MRFFSGNVYLCSELAAAQHDLTGCGTDSPRECWGGGRWAAYKVELVGGGRAGLGAHLGFSAFGIVPSRGQGVSSGLLESQRPLLPSCALRKSSSFV